eukprot:1463203-Prymnesium_polylepis.1
MGWMVGRHKARACPGRQHLARCSRSATIARGGTVITPRPRQICIDWEACTKFLARLQNFSDYARMFGMVLARQLAANVALPRILVFLPQRSGGPPLRFGLCAFVWPLLVPSTFLSGLRSHVHMRRVTLPAAPDACNLSLLALPRLQETRHLASRETPKCLVLH